MSGGQSSVVAAVRQRHPINPFLWFGETFPFGDPEKVLVLNVAQNSGGSATTTTYTGYALDQARANRGVIIMCMYDDLATNSNVLTAFK